jgi:hypothetical protein
VGRRVNEASRNLCGFRESLLYDQLPRFRTATLLSSEWSLVMNSATHTVRSMREPQPSCPVGIVSYQRKQSSELLVGASVFPEVDEPANHLKIPAFVVSTAINSVKRRK